jgi:hypothetical protein
MLHFYCDFSTYFFEHAFFEIIFYYFIFFFEFTFISICKLSWFLDCSLVFFLPFHHPWLFHIHLHYLFYFHFEMITPCLVSQHNFVWLQGKELDNLCSTFMRGIQINHKLCLIHNAKYTSKKMSEIWVFSLFMNEICIKKPCIKKKNTLVSEAKKHT